MNILQKRSNFLNMKESILSKLFQIIFALVMIGAAVLILILFEDLVPINIYFVYLSVGIILGLSVIAIIYTFSKKNEY